MQNSKSKSKPATSAQQHSNASLLLTILGRGLRRNPGDPFYGSMVAQACERISPRCAQLNRARAKLAAIRSGLKSGGISPCVILRHAQSALQFDREALVEYLEKSHATATDDLAFHVWNAMAQPSPQLQSLRAAFARIVNENAMESRK